MTLNIRARHVAISDQEQENTLKNAHTNPEHSVIVNNTGVKKEVLDNNSTNFKKNDIHKN